MDIVSKPRLFASATELLPPANAFADWLSERAAHQHRLGAMAPHLEISGFERWLANHLDVLAKSVRGLQAESPDQYDGRLEVMDAEREAQLIERGYARAATQFDDHLGQMPVD